MTGAMERTAATTSRNRTRRRLRWLPTLAAIALVVAAGVPEAAMAAPKSRFTPARKVGRGFANTTLGFLAIPGQMTVQSKERGYAAGLPIGFGLGLGWFVASELIGVWEILTCPFEFPEGYKPILEPEFPWQYFEETGRRPARRTR